MINIGTTEYLTLWPRCRIYWRRYSRGILYILSFRIWDSEAIALLCWTPN